MMTKLHSIILFGLLLIISTQCQNPVVYKLFADFPETISLTHTPIDIEKPLMFPTDIIFLDSAIVLLDMSGEYFLNFFSPMDFTFISSFIKRGRGPMEEESIFSLFNSYEENEFWYMTHSGLKTYKYNNQLNEIEYLENFPRCESFQGPNFLMGSEILGIPRISENKEFVKIVPGDCTPIDFGPDFPDVGKPLNMKEKNYLLKSKTITFKPDGSMFAASYHEFPITRIFNTLNGNLIAGIRYENGQSFPDAKINNTESQIESYKTTTNYYVSKSTNRFIYSTYSGKSLLDLQPDILHQDFKINDFTNEIHIFDWDGTPVKKLILDKPIFAFAVSSDDKYIVAIQISEPDKLLLYDL